MKIYLTSLLLLCLVSYEVLGQSEILTFEEAIQIGLENNITVQKEGNNLELNHIRLQTRKMSVLPTISASAGARRTIGNSFIQQEARTVTGTTDGLGASIDANLTLFNGTQNLNQYRSAVHMLEAQENFLEWNRQNIQNNIAQQYLQVLLNKQLVRIEEENLQFQNIIYEQVKTETELGSKAKADEYNQLSAIKTAELTLLRRKMDLRNAKANLALIMQIDPSEEFEVEDPNFSIKSENQLLSSLDSLENTALSNRGDYLAQKSLVESNSYLMSANKSQFMPSLLAYGSVGSNFARVVGAPLPRSFENQFFNDNLYKEVGVRLRVPIFSANQSRLGFVNQQIVYENSRLDLMEAENNIKSGVLNTVLNYRDALQNYEMAQASMEAQEISFQLNTESYELGLINQIQFTQASRDYVQAQSTLASARYTLMFQDILLQAVLGTLER